MIPTVAYTCECGVKVVTELVAPDVALVTHNGDGRNALAVFLTSHDQYDHPLIIEITPSQLARLIVHSIDALAEWSAIMPEPGIN